MVRSVSGHRLANGASRFIKMEAVVEPAFFCDSEYLGEKMVYLVTVKIDHPETSYARCVNHISASGSGCISGNVVMCRPCSW
jgi:hypothetical protein